MKLNQLLASVPVTDRWVGDVEISGISYDTRTMTPGCLFAALPGYKTDGHRYISQALEQGAAAVLCQSPPAGEGPWLVTPDPRAALAAGSATWVGHPARELTIAAVAANPWSAYGWHFEGDKFVQALRQAIDLPVVNVKEA